MKNKRLIFSIIFIIFLLIIDQSSKLIAIKNNNRDINNFIKIEVNQNTGMAFGFNSGNSKNIVLSIFIIILVINFMKRQAELIDTKTNISLCFILGGALGNLIDRFIRGGILDFIKVYKFPIFNIADVMICIGWVLVVIFIINFSRKNRGEIFEKQNNDIRN